MTLTISNTPVEVKKIADFMMQMDCGRDDNGKYEALIQSSPEKQTWIEQNFRIVRGTLDANLPEAFKIIEA